MGQKSPPSRDEAIELLAAYLNLSPEALAIAEGWSILPEGPRRHVKLLIDDYIASTNPVLRRLYDNVSQADQLRFNAIIEHAQAKLRRE